MKKYRKIWKITAAMLVTALLFIGTACTESTENEVVATAEIVSGGDLLISEAVLSGSEQEDGSYDFSHIFKYVKDYIQEADYAVINLETSLGGEEVGYCGFPKFNTPENIIDDAQDAGFDMFLTASNHSYDLEYDGLMFKLNTLKEKDADYIGMRTSTSESFHKVVDVNGIKIGMLNYTQKNRFATEEETILNRTRDRKTNIYSNVCVDEKGEELIAMYLQSDLEDFYGELKEDIDTLRNEGAEIIVAYPHWGREYNIGFNEIEDQIAQAMCDYGVDVIIGGHPHVVEPTKVYTSDISGKTTICIHSTGNFVSDMGAWQADVKKNAEYSEDGALFKFTAEKYADGTVKVTSAEVIPLWVKNYGDKKYTVIPLDKNVDWESAYGIENESDEISSGSQSYERTMSLVSEELEKYNEMIKQEG